jgi:hypothetical protein
MIGVHVGAADSDGLHSDQHFVVARCGLRFFAAQQNVRPGINKRFHDRSEL